MAESRALAPSTITFLELLHHLTRQMPSSRTLAMTPIKASTSPEAWLTRNPRQSPKLHTFPSSHMHTVKGIGINTSPSPPTPLSPSPAERAYQTLAFAIQSLNYTTALVAKPSITRQTYQAVKQTILMSVWPAMATRTQASWRNPFATLATFTKTDDTPFVDLGAAPDERFFGSVEFLAWFEEREGRGEVGIAVDVVCKFIENDMVLWRVAGNRFERL